VAVVLGAREGERRRLVTWRSEKRAGGHLEPEGGVESEAEGPDTKQEGGSESPGGRNERGTLRRSETKGRPVLVTWHSKKVGGWAAEARGCPKARGVAPKGVETRRGQPRGARVCRVVLGGLEGEAPRGRGRRGGGEDEGG